MKTFTYKQVFSYLKLWNTEVSPNDDVILKGKDVAKLGAFLLRLEDRLEVVENELLGKNKKKPRRTRTSTKRKK